MREIRTLRATWRGLETWNGRDTSADRRASPRPYRRAGRAQPFPTPIDDCDVRRGVQRNRSHFGVREPASRLTGGGQRGRLAVEPRAAGPPLRMMAWRARGEVSR